MWDSIDLMGKWLFRGSHYTWVQFSQALSQTDRKDGIPERTQSFSLSCVSIKFFSLPFSLSLSHILSLCIHSLSFNLSLVVLNNYSANTQQVNPSSAEAVFDVAFGFTSVSREGCFVTDNLSLKLFEFWCISVKEADKKNKAPNCDKYLQVVKHCSSLAHALNQ